MSPHPQFNQLPILLPPNTDYKNQTIVVPGTERPGQTGIYRHAFFPLETVDTPGVVTNLVDLFNEGLRASGGGPFLGHRPILSKRPLVYADHHVWQSWTDVDVRRRAVGSAVHKLFQTGVLGGGDMDTVGIWGKNSPNWFLVDLAMQAYAKISVSLYDTLGADSVEYVINHSELTVAFVAPEHIPFLLTNASKYPRLQMIVALEDVDLDEKRVLTEWAKSKNLKMWDMEELEEFGSANLTDVIPATGDDHAAICYTSGTSGTPKGVLLTHANMAMGAYAFLHSFDVTRHKILMSFLPLAHVFERVMELANVLLGKQLGYTTGDPLRFLEDIQILKPDFVALVPRVLNRLYQSVIAAGDAPGVKGALFRRAVAAKLYNLKTNGQLKHALWDRLVFRKVNAVLGGHLSLIATGSAPLSEDVATFLKITLLADVADGYGMTENCGSCTTVLPNDPNSGGTVGIPVPTVEIKLVDVPELGYRATDKPFPRGELCMRGAPRFKCYYKDEAKTLETIDSEGFLHSGDVATLDGQGRFKIIDRVKNIMKLAQGEYVALEFVENMYSACPIIAQLFVYGDSYQSYLVAVVVPDPVQLAALVERVLKEKVKPEDIRALERHVKDQRIIDAVFTELDDADNVRKLKGFEKIKRIHLTMDAFSVENNCLTPTLKVKRKETGEKYKSHITALYALLEPSKL